MFKWDSFDINKIFSKAVLGYVTFLLIIFVGFQMAVLVAYEKMTDRLIKANNDLLEVIYFISKQQSK